MSSDFLIDESFTIVIPVSEKPLKIIHEAYKIEPTDNPMEFTLSKKTTVDEMATNMNMSVEELMDFLEHGENYLKENDIEQGTNSTNS